MSTSLYLTALASPTVLGASDASPQMSLRLIASGREIRRWKAMSLNRDRPYCLSRGQESQGHLDMAGKALRACDDCSKTRRSITGPSGSPAKDVLRSSSARIRGTSPPCAASAHRPQGAPSRDAYCDTRQSSLYPTSASGVPVERRQSRVGFAVV